MKKLPTTMMQPKLKKQGGCLTIGLDLGDRSSFYCVLDESGEVLLEQKVSTTLEAIQEIFAELPPESHRIGDWNAFTVGFLNELPDISCAGSRSLCAIPFPHRKV